MHSDARFGYKIRPPKEWIGIPVKIDEGWLIAKYLSKRTYFYTDPSDGWTHEFKPEMIVIAFVDEVVKKKGPDVKKEGNATIISWTNRYKDYEDYLDKTYSGGGFYVSKKEEKKHAGIGVTCIEVKVEKLVRDGPKRIITWIYHAPDVDIAVQIEVLEGSYKKLKNTINRTLKSFKPIERTGELPTEQSSGQSGVFGFISRWDQEDMTVDERQAARRKIEEDQHRRTIEALPEGWKNKKIGRYLVVTNASEKYGKAVANQAEGIWKWLEKTFPYVGPEEYVRAPILRICKSSDEEQAYSRGGGTGWGGTGLEIVTNRESGGAMSGEYAWINRRIMDHWFQDRDADLYWAMPEWLDYGLDNLVANSHAKGSKLRFFPDIWNRDDLKIAARDGRIVHPRNLVQMSRTEFRGNGGKSVWDNLYQSEAFVYFLLAGDGAKTKKFREIIPTYLRYLEEVLDEQEQKKDEEDAPKPREGPKTEEEEEERFRTRRENLRDREKELLEEVFRRAFADWSEADWNKLERAYLKSID